MTGCRLHVSIVRRWLSTAGLVWRRTAPTLHIRDPHKEEKMTAGADWQLDYVTDFHYAGHPWPELEKDVDVSWTHQYTWLSRCGDISHVDAREFWSLWERNFMAYHDMGVFTVRTLWES